MHIRYAAAVVAMSLAAAPLLGTSATAAPIKPVSVGHVITNSKTGVKVPTHQVSRTVALPYRHAPSERALSLQSASATTIPTWSDSLVAHDGNRYPFTLVGKNPRVHNSSQTTKIKTVTIPVQITFDATGDVFDPTIGNCADSTSPVTRYAKSPIFAKHSYKVGGKSIGKVQFTDMLQRGEFYKYTKQHAKNPKYHVNLSNTTTSTLAITASGYPDTGSGCDGVGFIDINDWDAYITSVMADPVAYGLPISPTVLPVFLVHNVVFYIGTTDNCCVLGYHSAFNNPAFNDAPQTYSTIDYDTSGSFGTAAQDVSIATHEVAEWANDPFVNNPTPLWGNVGQVSGCQSNLEVGDPLTGSTQKVNVNHFTYHPQEEAFFGWFYGKNWGPAGRYSTNSTFRQHSTLCN